MVARGAGAAGPVLLACRQWDPLGLARRLPCPRVGAWRSAPLLPWRVQCPVRVCAALAAGSGGSGRYLVLCLSRFPLPAPRVPCCVWRAVPSGCPLPSLAGTPFHAVCAFCELGPVALLVVTRCPLHVCALALPRRPPPPRVVWRAHLARSLHWALVGPFHVVRAPPRVLPRPLAPSSVLGGGRSGPGSSLRGLACTPCGGCVPRGWWGAVPGGGGLPLLGGASGVRRCPSPDRPSSGAGSRGTATRVFRVRSVRAWGPSTGSTACALAGWRCSLWGWRKGVPGGGAFHHCDGRLRSGAVPPPTAQPLGGLFGSVTHMLWARACGCGGPSLPLWAACPVGAARRGGGGGTPPGGGLPPLRGASGVRRCPSPCRPSSGAGGRVPATPASQVRSVRAWGPSTSSTACALAGRRCSLCRVAEGGPRGGCIPPLRRASEVRRSPSPDCPPTWRAVGVRYPRAVGAGVWVWGPNTVPLACMPCGGCMRRGWWWPVPGGGLACHRCEGCLVSGAVPSPTTCPLGRAAGVPRPVCSGCGRCGRGDPAPVPQRAPLRAGVARCGGGGRASPGGVPSTIVRGV